MSFSDALKKYREWKASQSTLTPSTDEKTEQTTSGNSGSGGSFSDALQRYRESQTYNSSLEEWDNEVRGLLSYTQNRTSKWFDNAEYNSLYGKYTSLLAQADGWRKRYAGDKEVESYIDSVVSSLETAKKYTTDSYHIYSQYGNAEEYKRALQEYQAYYDQWGHYADEADFDEYSTKGAAIKNPTRADAEGWINLFGWRPGAEDVGNIVTYSRDNYEQLVMDMADRHASVGDYRYHYMKDEEVAIYNYLLAKEGADTAQKFLDSIEETLNAREGGQIADTITDINIPVLEDIAKIAYGLGAGVDQAAGGMKQFFTSEKAPTSATQYANAQIADSTYGLGKYVYTTANTIGNMVPSILVGTFSPLAGAATMGVSAAGNAYGQALKSGYSKLQARTYSTLVGASEAALQYLLGGIGKLGGVSGSKILSKVAVIDHSLLRIAAKLGVSIGSEIIEEELQNYLEPAFRSIIFGEEYDAPTIDELLETAIVTALSTGVLEGPSTIYGDIETSRYYTNTYGNVQRELLDQALEGGDLANPLAQKYQQKLDAGGKLNGHQIGRLVEANEQQFLAEDKAAIQSAAEHMLTKYGETGDVKSIAAALTKQAKYQSDYNNAVRELVAEGKTEAVAKKMASKIVANPLSNSEKNSISNSKYGQRVANELDPDKIRSGNYASAWAEKLDTQRINVDEYSLLVEASQQPQETTAATGSEVVTNVPKSAQSVQTGAVEVPAATGKESLQVAEESTVADKTHQISSGKEIIPQKVISISNGKAIIQTDNGKISADDIAFGNEDMDFLWRRAVQINGINPAGANGVIRAYQSSIPVATYISGAAQEFKNGYHNFPSGGQYADKLTPYQRTIIYELGQKAAGENTAKAQSNVDTVYAEANEILKSGKKKKGDFHAVLEDNIPRDQLNEAQNAIFSLADEIAQSIQTSIHVYAGTNSAQGFYNHTTDEIWLNLNATRSSREHIMAFTLAHEIVHRSKKGSPAKYKAFANFLLNEYSKQGSDVDKMVAEQIDAAERFNKTVPDSKKVNMTYEKALEEVVCDACQRMLLDTNAGRKLAEFGAQSEQNKSFLGDLKRWISELMDKLRSWFKDVEPDSRAAKEFAKFDANVKQILADMYVDMAIESGEKLSTIKAAYGGEFAQKLLNVKDISYNLAATESHKAKLQKEYSEDSSTDLETIMARYDKIIDIWTRLGGELNSKFMADWNSKVGKDRTFTIFKAQAGYKYNVELSSMCKKGVPLFEAIDTIVKQEVMKELEIDVLGKAEKEILYDILKQHNFEIPCAICYVEQARQREGVIIDAFLNGKVETNAKGETTKVKLGWNQVLDTIQKEMKANGVTYSFAQVSRDIATEKYAPANLDMDKKTQDAFYAALKKVANQEITRYNKAEGKSRKLLSEVTPEAVKECFKGTLPSNLKIFKVLFEEHSSRFKIQKDLLYSSVATQNLSMAHNKLYGLFNSQGGVSGYKTKQGTTIYWGDILGKSWNPNTLRNEGGVRNQSNSDFQMYTLLDQAQMYIDFTAKGYYLQAYTKVLSELKLFGLSRGKINASLIPKVVVYRNADGSVDIEKTMATAGLDENGNPIYDDIEGINHNEAFMLIEDPEYSKSICGICIGYSDAHINKLLDDNRVQQIIGFHDKTDDGSKRYKGARYAKNYNGLNEAVNKEGKTVHIGFNPYVKRAEKKFNFNADTETYEGTVNYNGKTYTADDIPRLAADMYLEMCAKKEYTPAYNDFADHPNYYKLLADFGLYDSQGHYAPHRKVDYNMPDTVPYLDANGKKQTMPTYDYIKNELVKELTVRDSIAEALADTSSEGIIPQFKEAVRKSQEEKSFSLPKSDPAPTFYSHMARVVEGVKQEKLGAASVINMLRGKGVKVEEIKWSGIEAWLDGKKSVTKAELLDFINGSMLHIEEQVRSESNNHNEVKVKRTSLKSMQVYVSGELVDTLTKDEDGLWISENDSSMFADRATILEHYGEEYGSGTKWNQYKLDGGENYRELVFKMPGATHTNQAMKAHWGSTAKGVLAHARIQDFNTSIGKMLFIEEIQSDWHNEGSKQGYQVNVAESVQKEQQRLFDQVQDNALSSEERQKAYRELRAFEEEHNLRRTGKEIPDAPFRNTYHEYVLKRLLRMAAEEGYDSIGWTTADIQSERWSDEYAEGYRIEYDQDIPKFLKKYGKQWGAEVGKAEITTGKLSDWEAEMVKKNIIEVKLNTEVVWSMPITDSMKDSVLYEGQVMYSLPKVENIKPSQEQIVSNIHAVAEMSSVYDVNEGKMEKSGKKLIDIFEEQFAEWEYNIHSDAFGDIAVKNSSIRSELRHGFTPVKIASIEAIPSVIKSGKIVNWIEKNNGTLFRIVLAAPIKIGKTPYIMGVMLQRDSQHQRLYLHDVVVEKEASDLSQDDLVSTGSSENENLFMTSILQKILKVKHQNKVNKLPVGEDTSPRALLANAFEGIITNDIEKRRLEEYKGKVETLNAEEQKLRELRAEIKKLSFAKGKRDTQKIKDLQSESIKTANRIATLDKMLLRLEAAAPLQSVLKREKEMAYKRAEMRGKEALKAYKKAERERDEQWQSEVKEKYQASKKKAIETRDKREAREKLQKLVLDTVKWITYPSKTDVKCPDILKQPYADFLNSIDLSSQRLANGGDPTKNDLRLASAMSSLATALERVMVSQDPTKDATTVLDTGYLDLPANFVQILRDMTENVKAMMGGNEYVVNNMPAEEVRKLSQMIRTLNHAIKEVSTLYANLRFANVEALGRNTMEFIDALGEIEKTGSVKDFVQWDNALPYYAFKRFGEGGKSIFEGLMDAQDKLAFLAQEIFNFREKAWTDKEAKTWSEDTHTIDLPNGSTLNLTTADAMSIYCLSRRQQGLQHLLVGGARVIGLQKGSQKSKDSRSLLTVKDIDTIISSLTDRQKQVAESIQEFMSTVCSEWGNEISMKRFLTKEFNEKFYFPIESNDENLSTKDPSAQQSDLFRLLNISATKPIDPRANNEVIIRNVFDVFTNHAADMARLNAYGMALLDYMKWLNYREKTANEEGQINVRGVRKSMERAFGTAAKSYVLNLVKDVNGRPSDGGVPSFYTRMLRNAKTAMVGNSLRVATLQVTSYPRAALVLSPKNLALGLTKMPQIEKAKKYCGIALWKSFGFYDTNIARSIEDQIKGVKNIKQKLIELSLKGAEWGDAITWGALWNACEYEVAATKQFKIGSEEFNQAVGNKLREVVYRTQVVDSTLTRSEMMRSKNAKAQELSAFMSEPTLSANILMDAGFEFNMEKRRSGSNKAAWQKTGKYVARAIAVYSIGQLAAALLEGLWDAWRDDDDEEFSEKFLREFGENLILDILPFNKIPIISDMAEAALSLIRLGYFSSDSLSSTGLSQTVSAAKSWTDVLNGNTSETAYNAIYKTIKAISSFYGVSFSGIMREGVALWNNTAGSYDITWKIRTWDLSKTELAGEALEAIIEGNDRQANSIRAEFPDEDSYQSAMRTAIKDRYTAGEIDYDTAIQYLVDYGGMEEDDAYWKAEEWMFESETGEDYSKYDEFFTAVETGKNLKAVIKKYTDNGISAETLASQITKYYKPRYIEMSKSEKANIKGCLLNAFEQCGVAREDATKKLQYWEFLSEHPDSDLNQYQVADYYEFAKPAGISAGVYTDYCNKVSGIEGDKDANGNSISGSKKAKVMAVINSLPITKAQKDALYLANGWAESKLYEAPWH